MRRLVRPLPVALHDLRALDGDLAGLAQRHLLAVVVEDLDLDVGQRQADRAGVGLRIGGVAGDAGRGLAEAVALDDRAAGDGEPLLGDGLLHRHAAAVGDDQAGEIELGEVGLVGERVEQRVHAREDVDAVLGELRDRALHVARIGNEDVERAGAHAQQAAGDEGEDVIERQRADDGDLAGERLALQTGLHPRLGGEQVGDDRVMQQRRALGHARRAAGVLQHRHVVGSDVGAREAHGAAGRYGIIELDVAGQREGRHHLLHRAHDEVHDQAFGEAQQVAHRGHDDVLHRGARNRLLAGSRRSSPARSRPRRRNPSADGSSSRAV